MIPQLRWLWAGALLAVLAAVAAAGAPSVAPVRAQEMDALSLARAFVDALNRGDTEYASSLFTADAVAGDRSGVAGRGAEVREVIARNVTLGVRFEAAAYEATESGARWRYAVSTAATRLGFQPPFTGTGEIVVRGGRIAALTALDDERPADPASAAQGRAAPAFINADEAARQRQAVVDAATARVQSPPDTQRRGVPAAAVGVVAAGVALFAVVGLAAARRPTRA